MSKRFKRKLANGKIHLLRWVEQGRLFGPDWDTVATFDSNKENRERSKTIIQLLNQCSEHTNHPEL